MRYTRRLPTNQDIIWLSKLVTQYPASRRQIVRVARAWNFKEEVISFLRLFSPDQLFDSRTDFVARCEGLSMLIRQEWETPTEAVTTQD